MTIYGDYDVGMTMYGGDVGVTVCGGDVGVTMALIPAWPERQYVLVTLSCLMESVVWR